MLGVGFFYDGFDDVAIVDDVVNVGGEVVGGGFGCGCGSEV